MNHPGSSHSAATRMPIRTVVAGSTVALAMVGAPVAVGVVWEVGPTGVAQAVPPSFDPHPAPPLIWEKDYKAKLKDTLADARDTVREAVEDTKRILGPFWP